jgi:crotonobetainyl-CoA:carnitine CoA-transferase CaiB-like acyl-CoA transferase
MSAGLKGLVVLEIADTPGAAFAVSLLADAGAEAIICEPPEGSKLRRLGFGELDAIRWEVLARNKRSVVIDRPETLDALLRRADLLVTDTAEPQRSSTTWFATFAALPEHERPLLVEIFPTGADRPDLWPYGTLPEFAAAASGVMALTGHTGKTPIQAEAPLADYLAGTLAAARALTALRDAHLAGERPVPIATPLHQALFRMIEWQVPVATALGRAETRMGNNFPMNAGIANMHPTGDGKYVAISAVTQATAVRLMTMVGGPELAADPRFATPEARSRGLAELYDQIDRWTSARSTPEILQTAAAQDVVLGPIYTTEEIIADEQVRARGTVVEVATVAMPSIVPLITGFPTEIRPTEDFRQAPHPPASRVPPSPRLRGEGGGEGLARRRKNLIVIELGAVIAGPFAGAMMAELGGMVIKVEPPDSGDSLRKMGPGKDGVPIWFGTSAREKLCVTLNLKHPDGKALFLDLIGKADVLVENFRPGVLERLGLGWDTLSAVSPRLVMLSISGFGQTGPQRERPGFGKIAEGLSGVVNLTGEADQAPLYVGFSLADASAGLFGVQAVAAALYRRDVLGGAGARIDLALYEPLMRMLDCQFALHQLHRPPVRGGTNDPYGFGRSGATRPHFRTIESASGRWYLAAIPHDQDAENMADSLAGLPDDEIEGALFREEIDFCPVFDGMMLAAHPYFRSRCDVAEMDHPIVGHIAAPGRIDGGPVQPFHPPALGDANGKVFRELLGLAEADFERLAADGAI